MPAPADVEARVIAIFADNKRVPPESLTPATTFEQLGIDSLDALNIAFALEEAFHVSISDDQLRAQRSVGDAIAGIRKLLEETPMAGAQAP